MELRTFSLKSVVVTGASRGIGNATARILLDEGWAVGINGRDPQTIAAAVKELGENAYALPFDVTDSAACHEAIVGFARAQGGLDAVVHCAGIMKDAPIGMMSDALVHEVIDVNVVGTVNIIQPSLRLMARQKRGSIVLFGSIVGADGAAGQIIYSASKAAISGIVRSASKEVASAGVRVNGIEPGIILTELITGLSETKLKALREAIPAGRLGQPADIVGLVSFLLSDAASYLTGQIIRVDGGLSL